MRLAYVGSLWRPAERLTLGLTAFLYERTLLHQCTYFLAFEEQLLPSCSDD